MPVLSPHNAVPGNKSGSRGSPLPDIELLALVGYPFGTLVWNDAAGTTAYPPPVRQGIAARWWQSPQSTLFPNVLMMAGTATLALGCTS